MGLIHLWEVRQAWDPFVLEMKSWMAIKILNLGSWGCSHRFIQPWWNLDDFMSLFTSHQRNETSFSDFSVFLSRISAL